MATIQEIKTKLLNTNALGRTNLAEKGVELSAGATTYDIMQAIAEIVGSSGSGIEYTNIVYNTDNTVTLTDKDGAVHTMSCTYEDGKLIGATYDGKAVDLTYNGDTLVKVGKTSVDVGNAPVNIGALDHTVTFTVDGAPYEIVSVKAGNSVNAPSTVPTKEGYEVAGWNNGDGNLVTLPITPTDDMILSVVFEIDSDVDKLYKHFNIDKNVYPHVAVRDYPAGGYLTIIFTKKFVISGDLVSLTGPYRNINYSTPIGAPDAKKIVDILLNFDGGISSSDSTLTFSSSTDFVYYCDSELPFIYYPIT